MKVHVLACLGICTLAALISSVCLGETITDDYTTRHTPDQYNYVPLEGLGKELASYQTSFVFQVRAKNDAHLALHKYSADTSRDMYEIVIGGWRNTRSVIRERKQGRNLASFNHNPRPLSNTQYRYFWVSWKNGVVTVGSGSAVGQNQFLHWTDSSPHPVNYISVSTGWGSTGSWRFVETTQMYTTDVYKYLPLEKYGPELRKGQTSFIFKVRAKNDAHLALHKYKGNTNRAMYEIVIGGWKNRKSVIRTVKQGPNLAVFDHPTGPLSAAQYRYFWVSWKNGVITVGSGRVVGQNQFMKFTDSSAYPINYISVSTGWGSSGHWRFDSKYASLFLLWSDNRKPLTYYNTCDQTKESTEVNTPDAYRYVPWKEYGLGLHRLEVTSFTFQVRAKNDAHLALHKYKGDTNRDMYEVVIGGWRNKKSVIRNRKQGTNLASFDHQTGPLSASQYRQFWVSLTNEAIIVGSGGVVGQNKFLMWTDPTPHAVNYISVSTGWGSTGDWLLDETTELNTPNNYNYVPRKENEAALPPGQTSITFEVRAKNDAHLALHEHKGNTNRDVYEIVIGGWRNKKSAIRNRKQGANKATFDHPMRVLSASHYRHFWVSWMNGVVTVGSGSVVGQNSFMEWTDPNAHVVNYISVSTGWGSTGNWRFVETTRINTPNAYRYVPWEEYQVGNNPEQTSFTFEAQAKNDVHLALHEHKGDTNRDMYEIVIGGWRNTQSAIRKRKQGPNLAIFRHLTGPLSATQYRWFWVSWKNGVVAVGRGSVVGQNKFLNLADRSSHTVNYISVSTGWGSTGDWRFGSQ